LIDRFVCLMMSRRKIISVFLIITLSVQLLPLKQMINWLLTNQLTEEIVHGSADGGKNPGTVDEVHKYIRASSISFSLLNKNISAMRMHEDEALYARFADDILTPPPNL
jgi:hypothetical protein